MGFSLISLNALNWLDYEILAASLAAVKFHIMLPERSWWTALFAAFDSVRWNWTGNFTNELVKKTCLLLFSFAWLKNFHLVCFSSEQASKRAFIYLGIAKVELNTNFRNLLSKNWTNKALTKPHIDLQQAMCVCVCLRVKKKMVKRQQLRMTNSILTAIYTCVYSYLAKSEKFMSHAYMANANIKSISVASFIKSYVQIRIYASHAYV